MHFFKVRKTQEGGLNCVGFFKLFSGCFHWSESEGNVQSDAEFWMQQFKIKNTQEREREREREIYTSFTHKQRAF